MNVVSRVLGGFVWIQLHRGSGLARLRGGGGVVPGGYPGEVELHTEKSDTRYNPIKLMIALRKLFRSHLSGLCSDCLGCPPAPSVLPGALKPAPAVGPASLTAFSTAAVRAGGFAPWMVSMAEPFLKIIKVGMARTPYCDAMSRWLSTLILANAMRFGLVYLVARDSNVGAIILQGPHQSAWKSATTMVDWRICRHSDDEPTCTAMFGMCYSWGELGCRLG